MNASTLVDKLLLDQRLVSLLALGPDNQPAIYQIVSPEPDVYPRLAVFEDSREYTRFADDTPIEEAVRFRIDIFARDNVLFEIASTLHIALRDLGFARINPLPDDYIPDLDVYVKSAIYQGYHRLAF